MSNATKSLPIALRLAAGLGVVFGLVQLCLALSGDGAATGDANSGCDGGGTTDEVEKDSLHRHQRLSRELSRLLPGIAVSKAWEHVHRLFPMARSDAERVERLRVETLVKHDADGGVFGRSQRDSVMSSSRELQLTKTT